MQQIIDWLLATIGTMGYPGIFILMAMESSVIPIPSELVMPPAGYLAQQGEMNIWVAILLGTVGSLVGAYVNYFAAHWLGRPLLLKYGKYVWITEEKFAKVETFFHKHGEISTFIGRLLPVIRHLISLPAGLAGMHHGKFAFYTVAGAFFWVTILTWIGYVIGENRELIMKYSHQALIGVIIFCVVLVVVYVRRHRRKSLSTDAARER
ncbi:SNARE associated golgi family protein [Geobacter metallireducens RCH3]|uniref:Membrane protein DedA n=1 Tax=Geobacter metallireducens (strain ATCC 53774 / DSM 7210 / GS-15) TaxID=269799 RepID=Q39YC9_GEOMG|nr:DedA family protein [Geobacter metallireducens]ABB30745.1 membrane protein DedA [Geobacter metallireducens GS-15]EHP88156.1 SNARE associated golgi family protein [Geobacter metallireducens RCH3]